MTERLDPKDAPDVWNYNAYFVVEPSTGGTALSQPFPTPTTFVPHRSAQPSTWFDCPA